MFDPHPPDTLTWRPLDLCAAIAKAARIPAVRPDRNPNRDDSLSVWWSPRPIAQPSQVGTAAQRAAAHGAMGIQYTIEPTPDGGPMTGWLAPLRGTVEFANGRGRLDISESVLASVKRVEGVELGAPLADSGDYYLFDSTGFVLVRPSARTFATFSFTVASYNYYDSREGWPLYFGGRPMHPDTTASADSSAPVAQRPIPIYWHMETYQDRGHGNPVHVLAAGRMTVADAPVAALSILRWFGPTQALASVPGGIDSLPHDSLGFTSVAALGASTVGPSSFNITTQHPIVGLTVIDVDLSRLTLPANYTEVRDSQASNRVRASADDVARWRKPPGPNP